MAKQSASVALGEALVSVGELRFTRMGPRQFSTSIHDRSGRADPRFFKGLSRLVRANVWLRADLH